MKRFSLALIAAALLCASPLAAQTIVPGSSLPQATPAPTDVVFGIHSGTTSKFPYNLVWSPAYPIIWTGAGTYGTAAQTWCAQDAGANAGILCNAPTSSTYGFEFGFNQTGTGASALQILPNSVVASVALSAPSLTASGPAIFTGAGTCGTSSQVYVCEDNGATKGMISNVPSGSTNGYQMQIGGANALQVTPTAVIASQTVVMPSSFFRNRLVNGSMAIDQRNNGASVTPTTGQYLVDRWAAGLTQASKFTAQQNAGSVALLNATGQANYQGITSSSAYSVLAGDYFFIRQSIEAANTTDLQEGTANAKSVTVSFWAYSSLTGTFGGALQNYAGTRSYPFAYTISSANTWTKETITIPGDTSGTWVTSGAGGGMTLIFSLGAGSTYSGTPSTWASANYYQPTSSVSVVGTNGATFYITGVQLEAGSTATPFEWHPFSEELARAQRYCYAPNSSAYAYTMYGTGPAVNGTTAEPVLTFPVTMRAAPTFTYTGTIGNFGVSASNGALLALTALTGTWLSPYSVLWTATVASGLTAGNSVVFASNNSTSTQLIFSAEL